MKASVFIWTCLLLCICAQHSRAFTITYQPSTCEAIHFTVLLEPFEVQQGSSLRLDKADSGSLTYLASIPIGTEFSASNLQQSFTAFPTNGMFTTSGTHSIQFGITDANGEYIQYKGDGVADSEVDSVFLTCSAPTSTLTTPRPTSTSTGTTQRGDGTSTKSSTTYTYPIACGTGYVTVVDSAATSISTSASLQRRCTHPPPSSSNAVTIGGAVGGSIGGLAVIALLVFLFIRRRRRRHADQQAQENDISSEDPEKDLQTPEEYPTQSTHHRHNPLFDPYL